MVFPRRSSTFAFSALTGSAFTRTLVVEALGGEPAGPLRSQVRDNSVEPKERSDRRERAAGDEQLAPRTPFARRGEPESQEEMVKAYRVVRRVLMKIEHFVPAHDKEEFADT